ncbi:MAG TPA: prolipoprotein diacylglyceryl transferase [Sphingorhabdus lacus]|uniref:Phosphatidylglycerol--prolipoprotein diacylglyceryl transferase n=1 Tax=Sphingorhabdus lacus TaxID=392610 RepID=A0A6I6L7K2_9SPHN|nr:prolipoprotein diacylglyceryl transferase [Sphingorhabdus lacus]QGY81849.1 prolipoprotein diacylglyceryl transferase [Sphingorhabdus lacus]HNW17825.1 prolipoprotein diacylglyceryl transferase [Sphingorhabdus lacus]HPV68304.1 prolipoprotein diacylglyceryl transferase [Sphingorhabdus lacus]
MPFEIIATAANYIQFENLGVGPVALDLGFFQIRWYSLGYLAGILLGYWLLLKLLAKPGAPMSREHADDMILYATLGIIVGGRLGYIFFYQPSILQNPVDIFKLWEGGMSLHGGTLGTIFAIWLLARKYKLSFLRVCDYIACVIPFGLFLVRLANFVNDELWGRVTDVPWAIVFPNGGPEPRHPSQLYEAALEGLLMAAIMWPLFFKTDARYKPGFLFGTAALIYGLSRFAVEFVREPDQQLQWLVQASGLSMGQWLTIPMILIGLFLIATAAGRRKRVEPVSGSSSVA